MTTQPEALRLADYIENCHSDIVEGAKRDEIAAELRRLAGASYEVQKDDVLGDFLDNLRFWLIVAFAIGLPWFLIYVVL